MVVKLVFPRENTNFG